MNDIKKSISSDCTGKIESDNEKVKLIIHSYNRIIKESVPPLMLNEWLALCHMICGRIDYDVHGYDYADYFHHNIHDCDKYCGLGRDWSIDARELYFKIDEMKYVQRLAILQVIDNFWGEQRISNDLCYREVLLSCGGNIK